MRSNMSKLEFLLLGRIGRAGRVLLMQNDVDSSRDGK